MPIIMTEAKSNLKQQQPQVTASSPETYHQLKYKIFDLYKLYFTAVRWFGILPFHYNGTSTYQVQILTKGLPLAIWKFNHIYLIIYYTKINALFAFNFATHHKYETMKNAYMFQLIFVTGLGLLSSLFFTQALKLRQVAATVSMWLKLEKHLSEFDEPVEKIHKRHKFLKLQYGIYFSTLICSCITFTGIGLIPQLPVFLSSLIIGLNKDDNNGEEYKYYSISTIPEFIIKFVLYLGEIYTGAIGWTILGSFDILMSMMCRTVSHALDKLTNLIEENGLGILHKIELYGSLRILVTQMNNVFGRVLFVQELTNMGACVTLLYGALKQNDEVFLAAFFITNGIALAVRIYLLYLPMTHVYSKSLKFKKYLARKVFELKLRQQQQPEGKNAGVVVVATSNNNGVQVNDVVILSRKIAGYRFMVFRPWGFHKISTTSIVDYVLAVFSYLVTVKSV